MVQDDLQNISEHFTGRPTVELLKAYPQRTSRNVVSPRILSDLVSLLTVGTLVEIQQAHTARFLLEAWGLCTSFVCIHLRYSCPPQRVLYRQGVLEQKLHFVLPLDPAGPVYLALPLDPLAPFL